MATVHINLARVNTRADTGSTLPVPNSVPYAAETIESSAASKVATIVADTSAYAQGVWSVTAMGGAIWVAFGADPVAGPGKGWLMLDGETRAFGAESGQRVAVADVA